MAVRADRFICWLVGIILLEHFYSRTMEVSNIGGQHIGGNTILLHDRFVGMAICTKLRRTIAECIRLGISNIMYAVTISTSWNVLVTLLSQRRAMDALFIGFVDRVMTFGTGLRNEKPGT